MDIPSLSIAMAADKVNTQWGIAMMSNAIDQAEETGDEMAKMLETSVNPNLGQNVDIKL